MGKQSRRYGLLFVAALLLLAACTNVETRITLKGTPTTGDVPLTVSFDITEAAGSETGQVIFSAGDGSSAVRNPEKTFTYTYTKPGPWTALVNKTTPSGQTSSTVPIVVNDPLNAQLKATNAVGQAPLEVVFSIEDSKGFKFEFDPGDGNPKEVVATGTKTFRHVYETIGDFKAVFISTNAKGETQQASAPVSVSALSAPVKVPNLDTTSWREFKPGGDTACSEGSPERPYSFFATGGKLNKVVIDFQGGGACWNDFSCSRGPTGTYANFITLTPSTFLTGDINGDGVRDAGGLYDRTDIRNPVKDWYHVYVPYCTGDVHWGNSVHTYTETSGPNEGKDNVVYHKGALNVRAVLDWVYSEFEAPETIFVTGCSAGAYGSMMWTPEIAKHYPNAEVRLMADCGAGIVNEDFLKSGFENWKVFEGAWPSFIPALDPASPDFKFSKTFINDLYHEIGQFFPNITLSQFNTMGDGNQIFYYALMNGDTKDTNGDGKPDEIQPKRQTMIDWLESMPKSMESIEKTTPNFRSYLSMFDENDDLKDGTGHCIIFRLEFYDVIESGKPLYEWVSDLVNAKPVASVKPAFVPPYDEIINDRLGAL